MLEEEDNTIHMGKTIMTSCEADIDLLCSRDAWVTCCRCDVGITEERDQ